MTGMSRIRICIRCDRPIEGAAIKVTGPGHLVSMSGARPDDWRHVEGDTRCRKPLAR